MKCDVFKSNLQGAQPVRDLEWLLLDNVCPGVSKSYVVFLITETSLNMNPMYTNNDRKNI